MYPVWVGPAAAGLFALWLGILTFLIWRGSKFLKSLFPKSGERDIRKRFEEIVKSVESFRFNLSLLETKIEGYQKEELEHIKRTALLRFNPYNDTGGDQSFTACFLNSEGSGIVITSLHARSGTRVFGKEIIAGKSSKYDLSKEERQVLEKAMK